MIVVSAIAVSLVVLGIVVVLVMVLRSPEGYEDAEGYHPGKPAEHPQPASDHSR